VNDCFLGLQLSFEKLLYHIICGFPELLEISSSSLYFLCEWFETLATVNVIDLWVHVMHQPLYIPYVGFQIGLDIVVDLFRCPTSALQLSQFDKVLKMIRHRTQLHDLAINFFNFISFNLAFLDELLSHLIKLLFGFRIILIDALLQDLDFLCL
jgi:hypothetical protein